MLETEELNRLRAEHLVETDWLAQHLHDTNIRVVDMRGSVQLSAVSSKEGQPGIPIYLGGWAEYQQGHIPGAIYLDWTSDIVDTQNPIAVQVAGDTKLARILGEAGIGDEHQVIVYDNHPVSQFAVRLWWTFRYAGHTNIRVLNGGLRKWQAEGRLLETALPVYPQATFSVDIQPEWLTNGDELLARLNQPALKLKIVDGRDSNRYTGLTRLNGRIGHIPGAVNLPHDELVDALTGEFKSANEIAQLLQSRIEASPDEPIIAYCGGGVAATVILFGLSMSGYNKLTNYDGSWN